MRSHVRAVDRPELLVAPCGYDAARYAVERWHYLGRMPNPPAVTLGAWEAGVFVGTAIYSKGLSPNLGRMFGFDRREVCELARLSLSPQTDRAWPTSAVLARSLRVVRDLNPGLAAVLSFADPAQGHAGTVYQATGWIYLGRSNETTEYRIGGRWVHTFGAFDHPAEVRAAAPTRTVAGKHRYGYAFTRSARRRLLAVSESTP